MVSASGVLSFSGNWIDYIHQRIPVADGQDNLIAGFWHDLEPGTIGGTVHYLATAEHFIAQYTNVKSYSNSQGSITFQIILYPSGKIKLQYLDVASAGFAYNGTVGIENQWGTDGIELSFNSPYIQDGLAVEFMNATASYSLEPGQNMQVPVLLDASQLSGGTYTQALQIYSNDLVNPVVSVPLTLEITGEPKIWLWSDSFSFNEVYVTDLYPYPTTISLPVRNIGTEALLLSAIYVTDSTVFNVEFAGPLLVGPQEESYIAVSFFPTTEGSFSTQLVFESNDPTDPVKTMLVWGKGVYPPRFRATASADIVVSRLRSDEVKNGSIQISNTGGSLAHYKGYVTSESKALATGTTVAALPASLQTSTSAATNATLTLFAEGSTQANFHQFAASTAAFTDSLYYESSRYADGYLGVNDPSTPWGIATKFVSPAEGFTLTHVHNFYKGNDDPEPAYLVILTGDSSLATATPVYSQGAWGAPEQGNFQLINLMEPQFFEGGKSFWIVFYYLNPSFRQGINNDANAPHGTFSYTFDFGNSWTPLEYSLPGIVPKVRALQSTSKWITLEPAEGELAAGESGELTLKMNASLVASGHYVADVHFISNDLEYPFFSIPLQVHVNSLPVFEQHSIRYSIDENTELQLMLKATDADGGLLVYRLLESYPNVSFQSTTAGASLRFLPSYEQSGVYSFTVEVEDDMQEITRTSFTVEVKDVNRAPVVVSQIKNQSVKVGAQLSLNLALHFQDPDNDKLTFSASTSTPSLLSLSVKENVLTISGLSAGTAIVSLVANDGKGGTAGTSFEVKVSGGKKEGGNGKREMDAEEEALMLSSISNYPNPFSGQTTIAYSLEERTFVRLQVVTPLGVSIAVLTEGVQDAGTHTVEFDAGKLPAGLYLYKLQIGEQIVTKRMIVR